MLQLREDRPALTLLDAERTKGRTGAFVLSPSVSRLVHLTPHFGRECLSVRTACDSQTAREIGDRGQVPDGGTAVILLVRPSARLVLPGGTQ